jgi:hypothetical protein
MKVEWLHWDMAGFEKLTWRRAPVRRGMGAPGLGQFLGKYMIIWSTVQFLNQRRFTDTTLATF